MKKKSSLPIKWILGILVILMTLTTYYSTQQTQGKNHGIWSAASHFISHNSFFQFLENILGIRNSNNLSGEASNENNGLAPNDIKARQLGGLNGSQRLNLNSLSNANKPTSPESSNTQKANNSGENNSNINSMISSSSSNNSQDNSELNAENNSEINSNNNTLNNSVSDESNSSINNSDINAGSNSENNFGDNSNNNPQNTSGTNSNNNPTDTSGNNSGDNSGNSSGNTNQPNQVNLPTFNPIPTDAQAAQSIAQQDQQEAALAALLASRQALVEPVQEQAQASKYQTVTTQDIPAPSTNQAPAGIIQKVQSHQISLH